jgi:hypothetical protein
MLGGSVGGQKGPLQLRWLAIATLAAIALLAAVHRAIFAALLARGLIRRKRSRANYCCENREQNISVVFHRRFNLPPQLKLR